MIFLTNDFEPLDKINREVLSKLFVEIKKKRDEVKFSEYEEKMFADKVRSYLIHYIARYDCTDELDPILMEVLGTSSEETRRKKYNAVSLDNYKMLAVDWGGVLTSDEEKSLMEDLSDSNVLRIFEPRYARFLETRKSDNSDVSGEDTMPDLVRILNSCRIPEAEVQKSLETPPIERYTNAKRARNEELRLSTANTLEELIVTDKIYFPDKESEFEEIVTKVRAFFRENNLAELFRLETEWVEKAQPRLETLTPDKAEEYRIILEHRLGDIECMLGDIFGICRYELRNHHIDDYDEEFEVNFEETIGFLKEDIALAEELTKRIKEAKTGKQLVKLLLTPMPQFEEYS